MKNYLQLGFTLAVALSPISLSVAEKVEGNRELGSDAEWFEQLLRVGESEEDWDDIEYDPESPDDLLFAMPDDLSEVLLDLGSSAFDLSFDVSSGWKRNVLLNSSGNVDAYFAQASIDAFWSRPSADAGWEWMAIGFAEFRSYQDVEDLDSEYMVLGRAVGSKSIGSRSRGEVFGAAMGSRQAFDISEDDFAVEVKQVEYFAPEWGAGLTYDLPRRAGKASMRFTQGWADYDEAVENYGYLRFEGEWKRALGSRSDIEARIVFYTEDYDEKRSRSVSDPSSDLGTLQIEGLRGQLEWRWRLDEKAHWSLVSRLVWEAEDDREGDYYERERWEWREAARWEAGAWGAEISCSYGESDYPNRLAGAEDAFRHDSNTSMRGRIERLWGERWTTFIAAEWVDKSSNEEELSYESSTFWIGLKGSAFWQ